MKHTLFKSLAAAAVAGLMAAAPDAHAILITINGGVDPQPASSGQGTIETWLDDGVDLYNSSNDPDLPTPGLQIFRVNQNDPAPAGYPVFGADVTSITIPTGEYDYLVLHWGGNPDRQKPYRSYYIGDIGGPIGPDVTIDYEFQQGLSWYALFRPTDTPRVPEGGSSVALLGLALAGVGAARRFMKKA